MQCWPQACWFNVLRCGAYAALSFSDVAFGERQEQGFFLCWGNAIGPESDLNMVDIASGKSTILFPRSQLSRFV